MFNQETTQLLTDLITLRKSVGTLTDQEMEKLDKATFDFAQYHPPKKTTEAPVAPSDQKKEDSEEPNEEEELEWEGDRPRLSRMSSPDDEDEIPWDPFK